MSNFRSSSSTPSSSTSSFSGPPGKRQRTSLDWLKDTLKEKLEKEKDFKSKLEKRAKGIEIDEEEKEGLINVQEKSFQARVTYEINDSINSRSSPTSASPVPSKSPSPPPHHNSIDMDEEGIDMDERVRKEIEEVRKRIKRGEDEYLSSEEEDLEDEVIIEEREKKEDEQKKNDARKEEKIEDDSTSTTRASNSLPPTPSKSSKLSSSLPKSDYDPQSSFYLGCRPVHTHYTRLNTIDEGTYGVVHRALDKQSGDIVALKKVKLEGEDGLVVGGFPITSLREINVLLQLRHENIVRVKEVVIGNVSSVYMVMEYAEHDLKILTQSSSPSSPPFRLAEVKTLIHQLLSAISYTHSQWILHRDIKTSNLLYTNTGLLKVCDFGLARRYGDPLGKYTQMVVTLWYRAPELLMGCDEYGTAIDIWSIGCVMGELLTNQPLFPGKGELDQLGRIFKLLGGPTTAVWPDINKLPYFKQYNIKPTPSTLRAHFPKYSYTGGLVLSDQGYDLLTRLLNYDPKNRITAAEALNHEWFREHPRMQDKTLMPTFPSRNEKKGLTLIQTIFNYSTDNYYHDEYMTNQREIFVVVAFS